MEYINKAGKLVFLGLMIAVSGCVTRPKPQYDYVGQPGDPEFLLESDFGVDSNFMALQDPEAYNNSCMVRQRVAYLQAMDSYYKNSNLPGPWKIVSPAGKAIVISGGWSKYGTTSYSGSYKTISAGTRCVLANKLIIGERDKKYRVHLREGVNGYCSLDVSALDGSSVLVKDYPNCVFK